MYIRLQQKKKTKKKKGNDTTVGESIGEIIGEPR
jgi:hypothetical protein